MNLDEVHAILLATTQQPYGFLKIMDPKLESEVKEMAAAGLVTATLSDGKEGSFTAVNSVTEAGLQFLRVFCPHDFSMPAAADRPQVIVPYGRPSWALR